VAAPALEDEEYQAVRSALVADWRGARLLVRLAL